MKQVEIDCYEVRESDGCGDLNNHICYVSSEELASAVVAKSKNYRKYTKLYTIFDTAEEIETDRRATLRKSALAKLTNLEKEALGLS